ncbi:MAG: RidA family protein [Geminicoccaceae bacterium]|nr:RidA family protein [Geminicoccaceae bacterium]
MPPTRRAWPVRHDVPISMVQRAGDFVLTSAFGPWLFDPKDVTFAADGTILDDGTGLADMLFDEQVHRTFAHVQEALAVAGCTLADVVECRCWLADARDFVAFNAIYAGYFEKDPPVRSVFPSAFMFRCKVEMQAIAYKPQADGPRAS